MKVFILAHDVGHVLFGDIRQCAVSRAARQQERCVNPADGLLSLAPEEIEGEVSSHKTDAWCLGLLLYELCSDGHKAAFHRVHNLATLVKVLCLWHVVHGLCCGHVVPCGHVVHGLCLAEIRRRGPEHTHTHLACAS